MLRPRGRGNEYLDMESIPLADNNKEKQIGWWQADYRKSAFWKLSFSFILNTSHSHSFFSFVVLRVSVHNYKTTLFLTYCFTQDNSRGFIYSGYEAFHFLKYFVFLFICGAQRATVSN